MWVSTAQLSIVYMRHFQNIQNYTYFILAHFSIETYAFWLPPVGNPEIIY